MNAALREAERQQLLLQALWRDGPAESQLQPWLRPLRAGTATAGLSAYRANAGAIAERALAGAFPTVAALIGDESFAALARDFWQQRPPVRGDLGEWGDALADFIAAGPLAGSEPYLPDSARLDWLVHGASRAGDGPEHPPALDLLANVLPEALHLGLRPGCALLSSAWPVVAIWQAHQHVGADRFDAARGAFAAGRGEIGFVWRDGFAVRVDAIPAEAGAFTAALLRGDTLATALDAAGPGFEFDRWLVQALQQRWLVALHPLSPIDAP